MFTSFALPFILYGVSENLGLNGGICVLSYGIMVGNTGNISFVKKWLPDLEDITLSKNERGFFSEIVFVLQTYFFVYIGISIQLNSFWHILVGLMMVVATFSFRFLTVKALGKRDMSARDIKLITSMGSKGLVAAVLASLPLQNALEQVNTAIGKPDLQTQASVLVSGGQTIQDVAYAVVLISIIFCSVLVWMVEHRKEA